MEETADLGNDFEVTYDEEYDPEREKLLKEQLTQSTGSLSSYWARSGIRKYHNKQRTSAPMQASIGTIFTSTTEIAFLRIDITWTSCLMSSVRLKSRE